jgi:hypothetical protein
MLLSVYIFITRRCAAETNSASFNFTEQIITDKAFSFTGNWAFQNDSDASHESKTIGDSAVLQFTGQSVEVISGPHPDVDKAHPFCCEALSPRTLAGALPQVFSSQCRCLLDQIFGHSGQRHDVLLGRIFVLPTGLAPFFCVRIGRRDCPSP